jgi:hypothetical protein
MTKGTFVAITALAVGMLAGCSADVSASADGTEADAASTSPAIALVSIDSLTSGSTGTSGSSGSTGSGANGGSGDRKVSAVARFVRARDGVIDEDALRMVHASLSLPDLGSCAVPDAEPANARAVSLLDLGNVSLESQGVHTPLAPRELPDVADLVDGVVYTSRALDGEALPASSAYTIRASGNDAVPAFAVHAHAPSELHELHLGTFDADGGDGSELQVDPSASLDMVWDAAGSSTRDELYVDVTADGGDGSTDSTALRCAFADTGHAELPAQAWAALAGATSGQLTLHRLHREQLQASGIGTGEIRFDFARQIPFRLR